MNLSDLRFHRSSDELVALASEAAKCGGMYISHMRSEGDRIEEAVDELIEIARRSGAPAATDRRR